MPPKSLLPLALDDLCPFRTCNVGHQYQINDDLAKTLVLNPSRKEEGTERLKVRLAEGGEGYRERTLLGDALIVVQKGEVVGFVHELAIGNAGVVDVMDQRRKDEGEV